ncbi:MAG: GspH/FimT family pseudopilin [Phycisphaerae bacterium]
MKSRATKTMKADRYAVLQEGAPTRRSAFTLTEMIVTLAIVSVLSAIALPRFGSSLTNIRLDNAARRIARDVEFAQRNARAQSKTITMTFSPASDAYGIAGIPSLESPNRNYRVVLPREYDGVQLQAANFGGLQTLTFDGYGVPQSGGSVTLTLAGSTRSVVVYPETGHAETF